MNVWIKNPCTLNGNIYIPSNINVTKNVFYKYCKPQAGEVIQQNTVLLPLIDPRKNVNWNIFDCLIILKFLKMKVRIG